MIYNKNNDETAMENVLIAAQHLLRHICDQRNHDYPFENSRTAQDWALEAAWRLLQLSYTMTKAGKFTEVDIAVKVIATTREKMRTITRHAKAF